MTSGRARLGVDVGGTFTDLTALRDGRLVTAKSPSTPRDQSIGALAVFDASELEAGDVAVFAHGMTVATNALLERRGGRTALVTTEGFRDVIEIGRQNRPSLYDLAERPAATARPARAAVHGPGADGAGGRGRAARRARAWAAVVAAVRGGRGRGGRGLPAVRVPAPGARAARRRRDPRRRCPTSRSRCRARCCRSSASTSGCRPPSPTPTSRPGSPRTSRRLAGGARRGGPAGAAGHAVLRRRRRRRAGRDPAGAGSCSPGPPAAWSGAAYVARSVRLRGRADLRHGRDEHRRRAVVGGEVQTTTESVVAGVPLQAADGRRPHGQRGRRLDRLGRRGRRAARRAAIRPAPIRGRRPTGSAATSRRSPTPTCCSATWRTAPSLGGEVVLSAGLAEEALGDSASSSASTRVQTALGVVRVADAEMGRALRVISVERGPRPARVRARRLRRRGRHARLRAGRGARHAHRARAARRPACCRALGLAIVRRPPRLRRPAALRRSPASTRAADGRGRRWPSARRRTCRRPRRSRASTGWPTSATGASRSS